MEKIVLFTSQNISSEVINYLDSLDHIELLVVTQQTDKDKIYGYRSAIDLCQNKKIPVIVATKITDELIEKIALFSPDIIINAYYPKIFPNKLIRLAKSKTINIHPGELPNYRGTFATAWQILNGEEHFTITLHAIDSKIDSGDLYYQERYHIYPEETGFEFYCRAMKLGAELFINKFPDIVSGKLQATPQTEIGSYYNKLDTYYHIDWHNPCEYIRRQVRVHAPPYFPAFTYLHNKCILISHVGTCQQSFPAQGAGIIRAINSDKSFVVSCTDGCLLVDNYQIVPDIDAEQFELHFKLGNILK